MSKRVADLLVETLETAGVRTCYGIIGDTMNRIAHAIDRSEIDWVHMRHEEAGAFAAQAEALLTGRDIRHDHDGVGPQQIVHRFDHVDARLCELDGHATHFSIAAIRQ